MIDGRAVLVSPVESRLLWLNPVATRIWELADGERSIEAIASALCEEFEVEADRALRDTAETVEKFVAQQLLEVA